MRNLRKNSRKNLNMMPKAPRQTCNIFAILKKEVRNEVHFLKLFIKHQISEK